MEKVVLGKEASEEQPVPLLVGDVLDEAVDVLGAGALVARIAEGPPTRAEPITQQPGVDVHVRAVVLLVDRQVLERGTSGLHGRSRAVQRHPCQGVPVFLRQSDGMAGGLLRG